MPRTSGTRPKGNGAGKGFVYSPPRGKWADLTAENQPEGWHKGVARVEAKAYREKLTERADKAIAAYDVAFASDDPKVQLQAAKQLEDRIYGQAKTIVETQDDTRTEAELIADVERKRREAGIE